MAARAQVVSPIVVTSTYDAIDLDLTDNVCEATAGQGDCTLRAAVQNANKSPDPDVIVLATEETYELTLPGLEHNSISGDLDIRHELEIQGNGAIVRGVGIADRIVHVLAGATVAMDRLTITGGDVSGHAGGGVAVNGHLDLTRSTVIYNKATGFGGGVFYAPTASGSITQVRILINQGKGGGGLYTRVPLDVTWSTIYANNATANGAGGIRTDEGFPVTLKGTIVANNGDDPDCNKTAQSAGYNLSSDSSCGLDQATDQTDTDPLLGGFDASPGEGSPVIDAGDQSCPMLDAFDEPRHQGVNCEIGAIEVPHPDLVVDAVFDGADTTPGDGLCATGQGDCTLRAAVTEANALGGPNTIVLTEGSTYNVSLAGSAAAGDIDVTDDLTLEGHSSVVAGAAQLNDRVFEIRSGATATLRDLVVSGGNVSSPKHGGGIQVNNGELHLDRVTLTGNQALGGVGGGVFYNSSSTGSITNSNLIGNSSTKGGGLAANGEVIISSSRVVDNTASIEGEGLYTNFSGAHVTLAGTLVTSDGTVNACDSPSSGPLPVVSHGFNVSTDASCVLPQSTDRPGTAEALTEALYRKGAAIVLHATDPYPAVTNVQDGGSIVAESRMARAFASYLTDDPQLWLQADEDIQFLFDLGYPTRERTPGVLWGEFASPLLLRLATISPTAWSHVGDGVGEPINAQQLVTDMVQRFLTEPANCDFAFEWGSLGNPDPWHNRGTENHELVRRTNCLLALYAFRGVAGFSDPNDSDKRHWTHWAEMMGRWVEERGRNGLLSEIHSPTYAGFSLVTLYNLVDFPGDGTVGTELGRISSDFLDLFWHDLAHSFNAATGVASAAEHRTYQFDPDAAPNDPEVSNRYTDPTQSSLFEWTYLYQWHDNLERLDQAELQILAAADSAYVPLGISLELAQMPAKDFEYSSMRPAHFYLSSVDLYSDGGHQLRRDVSATSDYVLGAMTYGPDIRHRSNEGASFSVTSNSSANDRIMISGIGEQKFGSSQFVDWFSINGTARNDVIVAGRNFSAGRPPVNCPGDWTPHVFWEQTDCDGNSRGMRAFLGRGEYRDNLVEPAVGTDWFFTRAGNAYVAIRVNDPGVSLVRDSDGNVAEIRLDNLSDGTGTADIWQPIVVQAAQSSTYNGDFAAFQAAVAARPFNDDGQTVTYTSLHGDTFAIDRQQTAPTVPVVNGVAVDVNPPDAYNSPYVSMPWNSNPVAPIAVLSGAGGQTVTLDLDWNP